MPREGQPDEPEVRSVNPKELRLGPIRREALSDDQLEQLRAIWHVISPYQQMAFETMELNFLRDANPDQELTIWANVAVALTWFIEEQPRTTNAERKSILSCLLVISMGSKRPHNIDAKLWQYLESLYTTR